MLFTWFMLAGFIFLFAPKSLTSEFQGAFSHIFRWPLSIGRSISLSARSHQSPEEIFRHQEFLYQNHIVNLEAQLEQAYEEIKKLSGMRNRLPLEGIKLLPASVITASISASHSSLTINRGENDGLAQGQFVLGDNSIVGVISEVWAHQARCKLITNAAFSMVVRIKGLPTPLLMQGDGNSRAKISLSKYPAVVGAIVMAERKTGFLEVSMIVGKVADCQRNAENPLLCDISIEPVCNIAHLTDVAVAVVNSGY